MDEEERKRAYGYGKRKSPRRPGAVAAAHLPQTLGRLFIDSGAYTLFSLHGRGRPKPVRHDWYRSGTRLSPPFRQYLDEYAAFVNDWKDGIDFYANVDAIYNPEVSWRALKYLEHQHGLNPVPVIHFGESYKWLDKHLDAGYGFIGVSGTGKQETTRQNYVHWADGVFRLICPPPYHRPVVRTHGFAMTGHRLVWRFPWWSVDSVSWAKAAGFGMVFVPPRRGGGFAYDVPPHSFAVSYASPAAKEWGRHAETLTPRNKRLLLDWFEDVGIDYGSVNGGGGTEVYGVRSEYNARAAANLIYLDRMAKARGPWSFEFRPRDQGHLDDGEDNGVFRPARGCVGGDCHEPLKIFYSGGSEIVETTLRKPCVMISAYTHAKNWKPNSRLRNLMNMRKKAKGG